MTHPQLTAASEAQTPKGFLFDLLIHTQPEVVEKILLEYNFTERMDAIICAEILSAARLEEGTDSPYAEYHIRQTQGTWLVQYQHCNSLCTDPTSERICLHHVRHLQEECARLLTLRKLGEI